MDPEVTQIFNFVLSACPVHRCDRRRSASAGRLLNNWLKIKNGYPLSN